MGQLVLSYRYYSTFAVKDIAGLVNRICEHSGIYCGKLRLGDLLFYSRVTLKLRAGYQGQERQHKLVCLRNIAVRIDYNLVAGFDSSSQVVDDKLLSVLRDLGKCLMIGKNLVVCDKDAGRHSHVLKPHTVLERAEVVAYVEPSCGAVAGKNFISLRVELDISLNFFTSFKGSFVGCADFF